MNPRPLGWSLDTGTLTGGRRIGVYGISEIGSKIQADFSPKLIAYYHKAGRSPLQATA